MQGNELSNINLRPGTLEECWEVIGQLVQIIQILQEKLNTNSNNSSLPPSKDFKKSKPKKRSGRKPGGQPGHPGVTRRLVPVEQVDEVITCPPPDFCEDCHKTLDKMAKIIRHQVYEIPKPCYTITEYQVGHARCSYCQMVYAGVLPKEVGKRGFGTRVHALLGLLTTKFRQSKRQSLALLHDLYGMPMSVGTVSNIEGRVSQSIAPLHQEVGAGVADAPVVNVDETGFKQGNKSAWAWVVASPKWTYFCLDRSRGKKVAKELLKPFERQVIVSDRYGAYHFLPEAKHQICWAHLKRDFTKMAERKGFSGVVGRRLLRCYGQTFAFWKGLQANGFTDHKKTRKRRRYLKNVLTRHLKDGLQCGHAKTARTCDNLLSERSSLWLFLENPLVPATNNLAERQLRPLVIAKKLSFGVQSLRGARFVERTFSVIASCQQQKINILELLQKAFHNHFAGLAPPTLAH